MKNRVVIGLGLLVVSGVLLSGCIALCAVLTFATQPMGTVGDSVAVIRVEGTIVSGRPAGLWSTDGYVYSEEIAEYLKQVEENPRVEAIVLRIDSPGGSVVGSDEIYQALLAIDKPLVVSMGEVAASGGYYIACAADRVLANPGTLTGSIGVISMVPNIEELMEKIGVEVLVIKSGALKDEGSVFREMTEEEREVWQRIIDEAYDQFVGIVADGRDLPPQAVRELADGRVYTGHQALELGLVDELGNLSEAIELAAKMGGIVEEPRIIEYPATPSLMETIFGSLWAPTTLPSLNQLLDVERRFSIHYLYVEPF